MKGTMYTKDSSVAERVEWMNRFTQALDDVSSGVLTMANAGRKYGINPGSISAKLKEIRNKEAKHAEGK